MNFVVNVLFSVFATLYGSVCAPRCFSLPSCFCRLLTYKNSSRPLVGVGHNHRGYLDGEQAYISYGLKSNDELLQFYGFVEADCPADTYVVVRFS